MWEINLFHIFQYETLFFETLTIFSFSLLFLFFPFFILIYFSLKGESPISNDIEPFTQSGDIVPMYISYGCKEAKDVIVTITMSPSFYNPMSFSYHKRCTPSSWRLPSLILFSVVLFLGTSLLILCVPCPCLKGDTLLKKLRHGKGQYVEL